MDWFNAQLDRFRLQQQSQQLPGNYPTPANTGSPWYAYAADAFNFFFILPLTVLVRALLSVISLLFRTLYVLDRPREHFVNGSDTRASSALMNDPIRRAEQFVLELEESIPLTQQCQGGLGNPNIDRLPPFFQGSYSQALYMASSRAKFLFVYLTNPHTEGSKSLFEKIIISKSFGKLFSGNEMTIIWGGNVANAEAFQLATNLNVTKFPMLGLLCLTRPTVMTPEGPRKDSARISLVLKIQGGIRDSADIESLIQNKFVKKMMRYEPELALIRAELREKLEQEALLRTQHENYQKSLAQDRLKKQQKLQEELLLKYLKWRQPSIKHMLADGNNEQTLRIAFKFENGLRVTENFPQECEIEDLFTYVELRNRNMFDSQFEVTMSDEEAESLFKKWDRVYKCQLTSTVPPRPSLNDLPLSTKIRDVNFITPSGLLMVESR